MSSKKQKQPIPELDLFEAYLLKHPGPQPVAIVVSIVMDTKQPGMEQVTAAINLLAEDTRFDVNRSGFQSTVQLVGSYLAQVNGPEEIPAAEAQGAQGAQEAPDGTFPVDVADKEPETKPAEEMTVGEHVAKAEAEAAAAPATAAATVDAVTLLDSDTERLRMANRALESRDAMLRHSASAIRALRSLVQSLANDVIEAKAKLKAAEARLDAAYDQQTCLIDGEPQQTIPDVDSEPETRIEDTPVGKAISGEAPETAPAAEPAPTVSPFTARGQGMQAAVDGKTELDCPFTRESAAEAVVQWFDGFREQMRGDHLNVEAIKQGLTSDKLANQLMAGNGLLIPGEECQKVPTVKWNERPHLVLDMAVVDGLERWALLPLFTRDEWSSGDGCFAETYGNPIGAADHSDETKAVRLKGGIDCGRMVKSGRSKLVVGPLQMLCIATVPVSTDAQA